jgi:hypothetical protein
LQTGPAETLAAEAEVEADKKSPRVVDEDEEEKTDRPRGFSADAMGAYDTERPLQKRLNKI